MSKSTSKRWTRLAGQYKNEKNITTSADNILESLELVTEYMETYGGRNTPDTVTAEMKTWVINRTRCAPVLAYELMAPGLAFRLWLDQPA